MSGSRRLFASTTNAQKSAERLKTRQSDGSEYEASTFGRHRDYFRNRTIKDQNVDREKRNQAIEAGKPQFFDGCKMACKGSTGSDGSATDLRRIVIEHGGVWLNYAPNLGSVTHLIAEDIRIAERSKYQGRKVVRPKWIYECERRGEKVDDSPYLVFMGAAGQTKLDLMELKSETKRVPPSTKFKKGLPAAVKIKARDLIEEEALEQERIEEFEDHGPPGRQPERHYDEWEDCMPSYQPVHPNDPSDDEPEPVELVGQKPPSVRQSMVKDSFGSDVFEGFDFTILEPLKPETIMESPHDADTTNAVKANTESVPGPSNMINGRHVYTVEAIIRERKPRNKRQRPKYLVKWKGYPESDNTWEPERTLRNDMGDECFRKMLEDFRERNERSRSSSSTNGQHKSRSTEKNDGTGSSVSTSFATTITDDVSDSEEPKLPDVAPATPKLQSSSGITLPSFSTVCLTPDPVAPGAAQQHEEPSASYPTPKADRQPTGKFAFTDEIPASDGFSSPVLSPIAQPKTPTQQSQTISPPLSSPIQTPTATRKRSPPEELAPPETKRLKAPGIAPQLNTTSDRWAPIKTWPGQTPEEFNVEYLNSRPDGWVRSVQNPGFLAQFFQESRLHQLSTWRSELKARTQILQNIQPKVAYPRRYVMHVDFDCFFAAVSLRERPEYKDKPVAIAHGTSDSSEIASCNYIARGFGIKNGMWMSTAKKFCPDIVCLDYEFKKYEDASREFYGVVMDLNALRVQSVSVDEVLVDITNLVCDPLTSDIAAEETHALALATRVRDLCRERTGCEVSVGVGPNILLAKLALRAAKPAGQFILRASDAVDFLNTCKIRDLPGIGPKTSELVLKEFGFDGIERIRQIKPFKLRNILGPKTGDRICELCNGVDETPVGASNEIERRSYSINVNWGVRFISKEQPENFVRDLCRELENRMKEDEVVGYNLTLNVAIRHPKVDRKTEKWLGCGKVENISRSARLMNPTADAEVMARSATALLRGCGVPAGEIRGLGVGMGKVEPIEKGRMAQGKLGFGVVPKQEKSKDEVPPKQQPPQFQPRKPASLLGRFLVPKDEPKPEKPLARQKEKGNALEPVAGPVEQQLKTPKMLPPALAAPPKTPTPSIITSPGIPQTQFILPTQMSSEILKELPEEMQAQYWARRERSEQRLEPEPPQIDPGLAEILNALSTQDRRYNETWQAPERTPGPSAPSTPSKRREKRQMLLSPSPHKNKGQQLTMALISERPPAFPLLMRRGNNNRSRGGRSKGDPKDRKKGNPSHTAIYNPRGEDVSQWLFAYTPEHITQELFHALDLHDRLAVIRAAERIRNQEKEAFEKARNVRRQLQHQIDHALKVKVSEYSSRASDGVIWICGERVVGSKYEKQVVQVIRDWVREDGWRKDSSESRVDGNNDDDCEYGIGCGPWCGTGFWGHVDPHHDQSPSSSTSPSTTTSEFVLGKKDANGNWIWPTDDEPLSEGPEEEHIAEWLAFLREIVIGEKDMYKAKVFVKTFLKEAGYKDGWADACRRTEEVLREAMRMRGFADEFVI